MLPKREIASEALRFTGILPAVQSWRRRSRDSLTIFAYHRVTDFEREDATRSDIELISASPIQFRRQMEFVRTNFTPITFAQLGDLLDRKSTLPPAAAIVTFDDGFADNYINAYPILRELSMPATIFVTTGNVDSGEPLWFERLARVVLGEPGQCRLPDGKVAAPGITPQARQETLNEVLRQLKRIPDAERLSYLRSIFHDVGDRDSMCPVECRPLTWDQIREMADHGIEFGSHTVTHPILTRVEDAQLEYELVASRTRIERMLAATVTAVSYPVGGGESVDSRVREGARKAGYRFGCVYQAGPNAISAIDWYSLHRIRVERYLSQSLFEAMAILPEVFAN